MRDARDYAQSPDRLEAIAERDVAVLRRARAASDAGDFESARSLLEPVAHRRPDDVAVAIMLQDATLAPASAEQREALVVAARSRADESPAVQSLLLAARIEPDARAARTWLERAVAAGPRNAWTHYALAHLEASSGNWVEAHRRLAKALEIDPGHRSARRLEAAVVARAGKTADAIDALELWIGATEGDPRIATDSRVLAELDLAHLLILAGEAERAREVLVGLADVALDQVRRWCLLAAAEQGLGRPNEALDAARAAQALDPDSVLPLVQEALLVEHHLQDREAARAAWLRVLEAVRGNTGLGALIQGLRARVVLERGETPTP